MFPCQEGKYHDKYFFVNDYTSNTAHADFCLPVHSMRKEKEVVVALRYGQGCLVWKINMYVLTLNEASFSEDAIFFLAIGKGEK